MSREGRDGRLEVVRSWGVRSGRQARGVRTVRVRWAAGNNEAVRHQAGGMWTERVRWAAGSNLVMEGAACGGEGRRMRWVAGSNPDGGAALEWQERLRTGDARRRERVKWAAGSNETARREARGASCAEGEGEMGGWK